MDWTLLQYECVDSTNAVLKRMPEAAHGTVVCSQRQTAGRGRLGRSFASAEGGLYLSLLLKRPEPLDRLLHVTPMVAVAVRRAVFQACGLWLQIKWVNDLLMDGRKVCGILVETAPEGGIIIGIGINCNTRQFPPELEALAASLHERCEEVQREQLLTALLEQLQAMDEELISGKEPWLREYAEACVTIGRQVCLIGSGESREAFAEGIDENGGLLVRFEDGTRTVVTMGEASVRGLQGYV